MHAKLLQQKGLISHPCG